MPATFKELTDFFREIGAADVGHTHKSYLAHVIGVYQNLKGWHAAADVCRAGMFHSIYGTEKFQKFSLPLERRGEIRELIGERAERLAYTNCVMDRATFDAAVARWEEPFLVTDRLTGAPIELSSPDFTELCRIHLCDWLEQVPRSQEWNYRRESYRRMADRLGGVAREAYEQVFAGH